MQQRYRGKKKKKKFIKVSSLVLWSPEDVKVASEIFYCILSEILANEEVSKTSMIRFHSSACCFLQQKHSETFENFQSLIWSGL